MERLFGVPFINYQSESTLTESNTQNLNLPRSFQSYDFHESLYTTGTGVNLKLGLIYKPVSFFRVGLAYHTPTYYYMSDAYQNNISTTLVVPMDTSAGIKAPIVNPSSSSPKGYYSYNMITPGREIVSLGFVIGKIGLVGIEGEFVNYQSMQLRSGDDNAQTVNQTVKDNYRIAPNLRVGTEWRLAEMLSLRLGYTMDGSPYKSSRNASWSNQTVSAGLGFNFGRSSLDFAFVHTFHNEDYYLYLLNDTNGNALTSAASLTNNKNQMSVTYTVKF